MAHQIDERTNERALIVLSFPVLLVLVSFIIISSSISSVFLSFFLPFITLCSVDLCYVREHLLSSRTNIFVHIRRFASRYSCRWYMHGTAAQLRSFSISIQIYLQLCGVSALKQELSSFLSHKVAQTRTHTHTHTFFCDPNTNDAKENNKIMTKEKETNDRSEEHKAYIHTEREKSSLSIYR